MRCSPAKNEPDRQPNAVLPVADADQVFVESCQDVFNLEGTYRHALAHFCVQPAANGHGERIG